MSPSPAKTERRRKFRKRPLTLVYVELAATNGGMMRDLSEEGFALRAMMPLRAGEKTPFSFSLNESARIEGEGEILWTEENGRVAGIRFSQISSLARTQIHDWLSGTLDSRKGNEVPARSQTPHAPTLDQLREELRSIPPRGETPTVIQALPPLPAPETVQVVPETAADTLATESAGADLQLLRSKKPAQVPVPGPVAIPAPIPNPPSLPQVQNVIDPTAEPRSPLSESHQDTPLATGLSKLPPFPGISESEAAPPQADPELPDISEILIQPQGRGKRFSTNPAELEPLTALKYSAETPRGSSGDWFTLSRAIGIMSLLTVVVAISAYHRDMGQFLIWLGKRMGGAEIRQSASPASNQAVPTGTSDQLSSSPEPTSPASAGPSPGETSNTAAVGNSAQAPLSPITRNTPPPVTPLSGMSTLSAPDANQGTGDEEYLQAMQLLRGKNAAADTPEAVRLLWISVEKGHPSAEVALADLYWHGRGVVRNCDQTRILLSAAARKGNSEAQKRLQQFQREGCE